MMLHNNTDDIMVMTNNKNTFSKVSPILRRWTGFIEKVIKFVFFGFFSWFCEKEQVKLACFMCILPSPLYNIIVLALHERMMMMLKFFEVVLQISPDFQLISWDLPFGKKPLILFVYYSLTM